jgi:hypothetical protein
LKTLLAKYNILHLLLPLALGGMNSAEIRKTALGTLGDMLYGHKDNCNAFATMTILLPQTPQAKLDKYYSPFTATIFPA